LEGVPPDLAKVVGTLVAKDPARRYSSADEALSDLNVDVKLVRTGPEPSDDDAASKADGSATGADRKRLPIAIAAFVVSLAMSLTILFLPSAAPLIGMLMFGNLLRESGVVERLSNAAQNEIINIVTIFLGLSVGSKLSADKFLSVETLGILALGALAFAIGTAAGVLMGKAMHRVSGGKINPLIGAAGVSAVPMAARVVNKVGLKANPHNFLLMHAMGPNVAGVIGSAVAAGILLAVVGG
jgi:sodium ion-translocating decarboxylase beta subunit